MDPATRAALRADPRLSRFDPLGRIIYSDDFDEGYNGWLGLIGNYEGSLDTIRSALTCVLCGLPRSSATTAASISREWRRWSFPPWRTCGAC